MDLIKDLFKGDKVIWIIFLFLCLISIVEVFSAASTLTYKSGDHWGPITQHSVILMVGVCIVVLVHNIPCKYFRVLPFFLLPISAVIADICNGYGIDYRRPCQWRSPLDDLFRHPVPAFRTGKNGCDYCHRLYSIQVSGRRQRQSESIQIYNVDHRSCFHSDCSRKRFYRSIAVRSSLFNDGDRPGTLETVGQVNGN